MANGYGVYESVAERRAKAARSLEKLRKKHKDIEPVILPGKSLAASWWGKAWNTNMESYADFSNRISRGKTYVRNNMVLDLRIGKGVTAAVVQGSRVKPYDVVIEIAHLSSEKWDRVIALCNHRVDSLEQLMAGSFPKELEVLFQDKAYGLFPSPKEIEFQCSCPDFAYMCKHVAAALYGIGSRLDTNPMLFFDLRNIDGHALIRKSVETKVASMLANAEKSSVREIAAEDIADIFGL